MTAIIGIPTARLSNQFVSQQLLGQIQSSQIDLFRAQQQMSTGHLFQLPSENPQSAARAISLQQLINRNTQIGTNLQQGQSYLNVTDSALSNVSTSLSQMRAVALGAIGATVSDSQRQADAQQVAQAISQMIDTGNQLYDGRYIFSGAEAATLPFGSFGNNYVQYNGDESHLSSYGDLSLLFPTNFTGSEALGALSGPVKGTAALNPVLTTDTRLRALNGGRGVARGSIGITTTVGGLSTTSTVDLSQADNLGDVARLIRSAAPAGSALDVEVTPNALKISIAAGNSGAFTISNVGGGSTASDLGINTGNQTPATTIVGQPLTANLEKTTQLADLLGTRATAILRSTGPDNDLIFQSASNGTALNGYSVSLVNDNSISAGHEFATVSGNAITIHARSGSSTAQNVADAANRDLAGLDIQVNVDPIDNVRDGQALVDIPATATFQGGSGRNLDTADGLQIVNGGKTYTVDLSGANTVEDLLNKLNMSGAGVLGQINATNNGIDIRSRVGGADFEIGENGGTTASDLGIRSLTATTRLTSLNYGAGVQDVDNPAIAANASLQSSGASNDLLFTAVQPGAASDGYTIQFVNAPGGPGTESVAITGKQITVSVVPGTTTANQVVNLFNGTPAVSGLFQARLDTSVETTNDGTGTVQLGSQSTSGGVDAGADFSIQTVNGTVIDVDIHGAQNIGDVLDKINSAAQGTTLTARLATSGNGIELVDTDAGAGTGKIVVSQVNNSNAALDLGLIPRGETGSQSTTPATFASAATAFATANTNVTFTAEQAGSSMNGATVAYQNAAPGDPAVAYDPLQKQLTFYINPTTTANDIVTTLAGSPFAGLFSATAAGNGTGVVSSTTASLAGGKPEVLTGSDPNPLETNSTFNALIRLQQALQDNDTAGIQRAVGLLDQAANQVNSSRVELAARQQGLETLQQQQQDQNVQLQQSLSQSYDVDFTAAVSDFNAREIAYQAALKTSASIARTTLLDYL